MPSYNKTTLMGNICKMPEIRTSQSGLTCASFSLAINRFTTVNNERKQETTFVTIKGFGKTADLIANHCGSGDLVLVEGRLSMEEWEDKKSGDKRSRLVVICDTIQFVSSRSSESSQEAPSQEQPSSRPPPQQPRRQEGSIPTTAAVIPDDDIPF